MSTRVQVEFPPVDFWRSLHYFNLYRLTLASSFVFLAGAFGAVLSLGAQNWVLFFYGSIVYAAVVLLSFIPLRLRWPRFFWQLSWSIGSDIAGLTVLSYASGGIQSSIGLLLLVSLAAAGMISRGKITLFFAALASIAALLEHSYAVLHGEAFVAQYLQVGLLCVSYFVVAWLTHTLAKYAVDSQQLAQRRGHDLASLSEANLLVMRDMQDGVLVVDEQGMIVQMNPSAERLLRNNRGPETLLSDTFPILFGQYAMWKQTGHASRDTLQLGAGIPARLRFVAFERDAAYGTVIFLEDMQRVQAEAQQIKLAALGRLTANIAHEVRNPLSAISYAAELLREEMVQGGVSGVHDQGMMREHPETAGPLQRPGAGCATAATSSSKESATGFIERRVRGRRSTDLARADAGCTKEQQAALVDAPLLRLVQIVMENTQRINRIVQDVMQLSRRDRAQSETFELAPLLHTFIEEFDLAEHLEPDVMTLMEVPEVRVQFDRGHLQQVLWNLCRNALRYCRKLPGSLKLTMGMADGRAMLSVQDDGPGVASEHRSKLFEPFFTTASDGTGLGLYIAKELCETNGARLEYHMEAGQVGACFRIRFGGLHEDGA
ncbi:MAG TPA: HAMP domain-containing sensor histidine kinase [Gallionella sp.]|nr:HAMP domain-containing sensor histidine kinase [Gallionella sp.]